LRVVEYCTSVTSDAGERRWLAGADGIDVS